LTAKQHHQEKERIKKMNNNNLIDTNGEETALMQPAQTPFIPLEQIPDLDNAPVLDFDLTPTYLTFDQKGMKVRVVYIGQIRVPKNENGQIVYLPGVALQGKDRLFINATSNIVQTLQTVPIGTAIEITYVGDEKTTNGYMVKKFSIRPLALPRVEAIVNAQTQPQTSPAPAPALPAENKPAKIEYKNAHLATEYWTLVYSHEFRFTEQEGRDHLAECGNDFARAIAALKGEDVVGVME
jgi:hypothetical protein